MDFSTMQTDILMRRLEVDTDANLKSKFEVLYHILTS